MPPRVGMETVRWSIGLGLGLGGEGAAACYGEVTVNAGSHNVQFGSGESEGQEETRKQRGLGIGCLREIKTQLKASLGICGPRKRGFQGCHRHCPERGYLKRGADPGHWEVEEVEAEVSDVGMGSFQVVLTADEEGQGLRVVYLEGLVFAGTCSPTRKPKSLGTAVGSEENAKPRSGGLAVDLV